MVVGDGAHGTETGQIICAYRVRGEGRGVMGGERERERFRARAPERASEREQARARAREGTFMYASQRDWLQIKPLHTFERGVVAVPCDDVEGAVVAGALEEISPHLAHNHVRGVLLLLLEGGGALV